MKLFFISPFCLLRPTTNRIFDVRFCDMMAGSGAEVTLVYPFYFMRENMDQKDLEKSYGISNPVGFRMLKTPLSTESPRWWQRIVLMVSFFFSSLKIIFSKQGNSKETFIVGRDNKSLLPVMVLKKLFGNLVKVKIVNTVHEVKKGRLNERMYKGYDGILVTTASAKEELLRNYHIPEAKIERLITPLSKINYSATKEEARKKINYTGSDPLVVYTGKLGEGIRELDYILDAAAMLPQYKFILTGGKPEAVQFFAKQCNDRNIQNVILPGFVNDAGFISQYQLAADVLISYYTKEDHTVEYNFPQKLVEYMYSRNPIVTPDFIATRDIINASNAILVQPDNVQSFAEGIKKAIEDKEMSKVIAEQAFVDVQQFSSENRAEQLVRFFQKL